MCHTEPQNSSRAISTAFLIRHTPQNHSTVSFKKNELNASDSISCGSNSASNYFTKPRYKKQPCKIYFITCNCGYPLKSSNLSECIICFTKPRYKNSRTRGAEVDWIWTAATVPSLPPRSSSVSELVNERAWSSVDFWRGRKWDEHDVVIQRTPGTSPEHARWRSSADAWRWLSWQPVLQLASNLSLIAGSCTTRSFAHN